MVMIFHCSANFSERETANLLCNSIFKFLSFVHSLSHSINTILSEINSIEFINYRFWSESCSKVFFPEVSKNFCHDSRIFFDLISVKIPKVKIPWSTRSNAIVRLTEVRKSYFPHHSMIRLNINARCVNIHINGQMRLDSEHRVHIVYAHCTHIISLYFSFRLAFTLSILFLCNSISSI